MTTTNYDKSIYDLGPVRQFVTRLNTIYALAGLVGILTGIFVVGGETGVGVAFLCCSGGMLLVVAILQVKLMSLRATWEQGSGYIKDHHPQIWSRLDPMGTNRPSHPLAFLDLIRGKWDDNSDPQLTEIRHFYKKILLLPLHTGLIWLGLSFVMVLCLISQALLIELG